MKILIVGSQGNMGRRYASILNYLGHESIGYDVKTHQSDVQIVDLAKESDGVILASPTEVHLYQLKLLAELSKPILCEKPFIKTAPDMAYIKYLDDILFKICDITMVDQYAFIPDVSTREIDRHTFYDFYHSGNDGIAWDCINIIWHARGTISLSNISPFWECEINGDPLTREEIDQAYIEMVRAWLDGERKEQQLVERHQKVLDYLDGKYS